jgi:hypothetical protein
VNLREVRDLLDSSRLAVRAALDSSAAVSGDACLCGACNRGREYVRRLDRFLEANPSFGLPAPPPQAAEAPAVPASADTLARLKSLTRGLPAPPAAPAREGRLVDVCEHSRRRSLCPKCREVGRP